MRIYFSILLSLFVLTSCTSGGSGTTSSGSTTTPTSWIQAKIPSPTFGSGKHTLTIFADFQCPACIATDKIVGPIFEEYVSKGYVQVTYKQFPLTSIHKNAEWDALAALCSTEQGKYMEYKKALYALEEVKSGAKVSDEDRVNASKGILDATKLAECIKANRYLDQVRAEMKEGNALGISGTPTVLLDGKKLDNSVFRDPVILRSLLDTWLEVPKSASGAVK